MSYYLAKTIETSFDDAIERTTKALADEGFGIMTEIDVKGTLKKKLDMDFRAYKILGACNPVLAHKVISSEDKIGALLPCNVMVQETAEGSVEIAAVDPVSWLDLIKNPELEETLTDVRGKLQRVIDAI